LENLNIFQLIKPPVKGRPTDATVVAAPRAGKMGDVGWIVGLLVKIGMVVVSAGIVISSVIVTKEAANV
jgi:hypothetical protein